MTITSPQNAKIKLVRSLYENKGRAANNAFVAEGPRFSAEIPENWNVRFYLVSETFAQKADIGKFKARAAVYVADDQTFASASDTVSPQGILAVCEKPDTGLSDEAFNGLFQPRNTRKGSKKNQKPLFLLLENTQDPGNLGAAIRTADAAGAACVFISKDSVDVFNPKVIRAAAGSVFHLPFFTVLDIVDVIEKLQRAGTAVYAASANGAECLYSLDLTGNCAFVIGNEARGLRPETVKRCGAAVSIPIEGMAESLNASVACGVLLYEALRQRGR